MDLKNFGIQEIGKPDASSHNTVIVVGTGRGGTSMCAKTLSKLGLFMGDRAPPPTFENLDIYEAKKNNDWTRIDHLISSYDRRFDSWGLKLPVLNNNLHKLNNLLRNPTYIFIFRDLAAIGNRASLSQNVSIIESMLEAHESYETMLRFIQTQQPHGLLCSYEKVLENKELFVSKVAHLLPKHLKPSAETIEEAVGSIERSPNDYLELTSFRGEMGYLDSANKDRITGWATLDGNNGAKLELLVNNQVLFNFYANNYRSDLFEKKIHHSGRCAFEIAPAFSLKKGDSVLVRFAASKKALTGSPIILT